MVERLKSLPFGVTAMLPGLNAPAVGPYSAGKIIKTPEGIWGYTSGQIGRNPETLALAGDKAASQAE